MPSTESFACVAFDVGLGERARKEGLVYDVNHRLLRDALLMGNMTDDDIATYPIVIKDTDDSLLAGAAVRGQESDDNPWGTHIELYTHNGRGEITTQTAAHEAKHISDELHIGESAFVNKRAKSIRKAAVTVGSIALGLGFYHAIGGDTTLGLRTLEDGGPALLETDLLISAGLMLEYTFRKQERRARKVEKSVERNSILQIANNTIEQQPEQNDTADTTLTVQSPLREARHARGEHWDKVTTLLSKGYNKSRPALTLVKQMVVPSFSK